MINKKIVLFFILICFAKIFYMQSRQITQMSLGSEWGPGIFPESAVVYRLLPVISYMRTMVFKKIAKAIVKRPNFKENFNSFTESNFKMELRRQYYLWKKGEFIDESVLSFSIAELFNAGMLDARIEYAKKKKVLDLSNLHLDSLYGLYHILDDLPNVVIEINLRNNNLNAIYRSNFINYLSQLQRLDISYNQIKQLDDGCFDNLLNLEFLDIGNNNISLLPSDIFTKLSKLKKLDLSDNNISTLNRFSFVPLINLQYLNLGDNQITFLPPSLFSSLKKLKQLYLKGNPIRDKSGEIELRKTNPIVLVY